jgi:hypothetical protein
MSLRTRRCLCAGVRFEFDRKPADASFCHCSICRKLRGSAFAAYFEVAKSALRVAEGSRFISSYAATSRLTKRFCGKCGTPLFTYHSEFPGFAYVSLGALDDDRDVAPEYHQFDSSKAGWYEMLDGLPQFREWSDTEPANVAVGTGVSFSERKRKPVRS